MDDETGRTGPTKSTAGGRGTRVAVFGATGGIGRHLVPELVGRGVEVRVVSRSRENLERDFAGSGAEIVAADIGEREAADRAAEGCDVVVHAVGLPAEAFERHLPLARSTVEAADRAGARSFLVTSYWSYGPGDDGAMSEDRARTGDSRMSEVREEQERIFLEEGGAVARLPDFFGPDPGFSLLNDGLESLVEGDTVSWPGDPDAPRDFVYYPDAGRLLADLVLDERSYGEPWNVPGSGPESPRSLLESAGGIVGRELRLRRIRRWMAYLVAPFDSEVRAFLDIMPLYEAPVVLDCSKLERLLGEVERTDYGEALSATLDWMEARR